MKSAELFEAQVAAWGLRLDGEQLDGLLTYARILALYGKANVIGTKDLDRIVLDHVLDSLSCFLHEPLREVGSIADVGSGGGLPGIPLSLARPEVSTTLIEATGKKARFLQYATEDLGLTNVDVVNARVEDVGRSQEHRGAYGAVTTRAVAPLSVVAEYCVPLLGVGGQAIAMKGRLEREEIEGGERAAGVLGAAIVGVQPVELLPEVGEKQRNLVIMQKEEETSARYPRKPGTVVKRPLGAS